ncbi:unnamed protein product [Prorocentrum cordatum]|uniref:ADP-ribosylation factor-like protein 6 n=1 Tax=Prorocentrum cordatum TaxID=2364126 RepID=A0ABN9V7H6_9DINO|nr:unnamed protein product [Polarella glacialis]|mmetsp:Transcript_42514/g.96730  ORF Transcript_42514/g.96730 Transcript_42514/m.96730 type:complete len:251 (+) Transcript_42514:83-835(+)
MGRAAELLQRLPLQSKGEKRILLLGLDAAGKTTVLQKLAPCSEQSPTASQSALFNVETVAHRGRSLSMWDVGFAGRDKIRPLLLPFYKGVCGIIFVVDSSSADRMAPAREELEKILRVDDVGDSPLLIFANKQDLPCSMTSAEVTDALGLKTLNRQWRVQPASAKLGTGLHDGLDWLTSSVFSKGSPVSLPKFARSGQPLLDGAPPDGCDPCAVPSPARSRRAPGTPRSPQHCLAGWRSPKSGSRYMGMD